MLAQLGTDATPTHRYFKARPTAPSVNPSTSYYESSPATTPSKRRVSAFTPRKGVEEYTSSAFGREWSDDATGQTWTARERIKTASCVALSRDGQWFAVGEAGYNPRVLLFSTTEDALTDIPTSTVTDHTYGLRCVAFSSDMKYLATLGDYKDGFLFIWTFNSRTGQLTLHSANKCTANICDMTWCGDNLITVGTRSIRIWQVQVATKQSPTRRPRFRASEVPSSPGPAPLHGRNVILGPMGDCTFTCITPIEEGKVIIGTETGHLCLVDVQTALDLKVLRKLNLAISSIAFVSTQSALLVGTSRGVQREDLDNLRKEETTSSHRYSPRKPPRLSIRRSLGLLHETEKSLIAIGSLANHTISLDNDGSLQIQHNSLEESDRSQPTFAAHKSVILGVQTLPDSAGRGSFFTYSKNGEVKFWNMQGTLLKQETLALDPTESYGDSCENELTRLLFLPSGDCSIAGDRLGVLKLIKNHDWEIAHTMRAHSAEVTSIDVLNSASLVATCSRDRMIQLFRVDDDKFVLEQSMDDHVGAVNQALFILGGEKLVSCSTDRSLIIRERVLREQESGQSVAYLTSKVLTLKGSPLAMTMCAENTLAVSTMDRRVTKVDVSIGTMLDSFKVGDSDSDDTVSLNSMVCTGSPDGSQKMLVGYCSLDKSIRVYSDKHLTLLARESGHTEGVSDIALLQSATDAASGSRCTVVSTGLDGTIMIWSITKTVTLLPTPGASYEPTGGFGLGIANDNSETAKPSPASLPPMRKVLTKMEIVDLTRANGQLSPASPRSLSPIRLKRQTSRLALATSVEEIEETKNRTIAAVTRTKSPGAGTMNPRRSPSPPVKLTSKLRTQRSRPELGIDHEARIRTISERSPSPPILPTPLTPKHRQTANNGRLRRPPSVPSDLRTRATAQGRRQSTSQASEFGSLAVATDQAGRMLKIYKKKLVNSKEIANLDDLEHEVSDLLKTMRDRKDRMLLHQQEEAGPASRKEPAKAATKSDVDQLAILMKGSTMAGSPTTPVDSKDMPASLV